MKRHYTGEKPLSNNKKSCLCLHMSEFFEPNVDRWIENLKHMDMLFAWLLQCCGVIGVLQFVV